MTVIHSELPSLHHIVRIYGQIGTLIKIDDTFINGSETAQGHIAGTLSILMVYEIFRLVFLEMSLKERAHLRDIINIELLQAYDVGIL